MELKTQEEVNAVRNWISDGIFSLLNHSSAWSRITVGAPTSRHAMFRKKIHFKTKKMGPFGGHDGSLVGSANVLDPIFSIFMIVNTGCHYRS